MKRAATHNPDRCWTGLSLVLTNHRGMVELHAAHLGSRRRTDVLSFAYPPQPPATTGDTGEVIVNLDRAWEQGLRRQGVARELAWYVAHGCLHLAGEEDHTPALRARMRWIEQQWLRRAAARGLIEPLAPSAAAPHE